LVFQIRDKEIQGIMGNALNRYVKTAVVQRRLPADQVDMAGDYEREFSCYPPPLCMILISIIEVMLLQLLLGFVIRHELIPWGRVALKKLTAAQ
jgi:hypothetical protein